MRYKSLSTSDGNIIHIYDDVFTEMEREYHADYCLNSSYKFYYQPNFLENKFQHYLKSTLSCTDVNNFHFFTNNNINKIVKSHIGSDVELNESWILATSVSMLHIDNNYLSDDSFVLLYHVSLEWRSYWHGQTLFANNQKECELAVDYNPGRIIVYNSKIFHGASPIANHSNQVRFVFAAVVKNKNVS